MNEHGALGPLAFVAIRTVQTVVKIIPAEPLEIGAGYAFGSWWGMALCMLGTAIGSLIIIGLTKLFGMRMVEVFVPREKLQSFRFLQNTKKLNLLLFIIFLIPGTPKDLITYFVGVTPVNPFAFLLLTGIARIPSILSSTVRQRIGRAQFLVCGDCIPFDGRINCGRHFSLTGGLAGRRAGSLITR